MRVFGPESSERLAGWLAERGGRNPPPLFTGADPSRLSAPEVMRDLRPPPETAIVSCAALRHAEHRPRDLTCRAGAGLRVRELLDRLAAHGQWLPLEGEALRLSVGGLVAAAPAGAFDSAFGPLRRHLLECRVVSPAGTALRWGRPVMKNVAGYDLVRLVCGSRGRLGAVVEATFRVWPRPAVHRRLVVGGGPGARSLAVRLAIDPARRAPAVDAVVWEWDPEVPEGPGWLQVELAGGAAAVAKREAGLRRWSAEHSADVREPADASDPADAPEPQTGGEEGASAPRTRSPSRSAYRVAAGRRYLDAAIGAVLEGREARIVRLRALPLAGLVCFETEREAGADPLARLLADVPQARAVVERGSAEEMARAEARRPAGVRSLESGAVEALGGWPRQWRADYL